MDLPSVAWLVSNTQLLMKSVCIKAEACCYMGQYGNSADTCSLFCWMMRASTKNLWLHRPIHLLFKWALNVNKCHTFYLRLLQYNFIILSFQHWLWWGISDVMELKHDYIKLNSACLSQKYKNSGQVSDAGFLHTSSQFWPGFFFRLYLINSPVVRADNLRFKEEGVRDVLKDVFLPWYNAYRFLMQNVERLERVWKIQWLKKVFSLGFVLLLKFNCVWWF